MSMADDMFRNPNLSAWETNDPSRMYSQSRALVHPANNYVMPNSGYPSPTLQPYVIDSRSVQPTIPMKTVPDTASTKSDKGCWESITSKITVSQVIGLLAGLIVTGVPMIVMVTLFIQQSASTTTASTSAANAVTTTAPVGGLPAQCSSSAHSLITDATRLVTNTFTSCCPTECSFSSGWYRISGAAGTRLVTSPVNVNSCGVSQPMWFNGTLPTVVGATTSGVGCANSGGNLCHPSFSSPVVLATNCGSYFVFFILTPPSCSWNRHCTTF